MNSEQYQAHRRQRRFEKTVGLLQDEDMANLVADTLDDNQWTVFARLMANGATADAALLDANQVHTCTMVALDCVHGQANHYVVHECAQCGAHIVAVSPMGGQR